MFQCQMKSLNRLIAVCFPFVCIVLTFPSQRFAAEEVKKAEAAAETEMKPYTEIIQNPTIKFEMVPIPGGTFVMGSPKWEPYRNKDEGPQRPIQIEPFWMGRYEVTWDEFEIWLYAMDIRYREKHQLEPTPLELQADALTRPSSPYLDLTFAMGHKGHPAISMTQFTVKMYCRWLSLRTGHYYRLPTEAEWEYACRAGTATAYSWGDDPGKVYDYGWCFDNAMFETQPVGKKKPNPWGLYDMHGNVAEWVLDQYLPYFFPPGDPVWRNPVAVVRSEYPQVVRGGSFLDDVEALRCAARESSNKEWKVQDPDLPQSIWYYTDAWHVGFRLVRPLRVPSLAERRRLGLDPVLPPEILRELKPEKVPVTEPENK